MCVITVAGKLFVQETAQMDDSLMVDTKLLDALRVSNLQYIQTRSKYSYSLVIFFALGARVFPTLAEAQANTEQVFYFSIVKAYQKLGPICTHLN